MPTLSVILPVYRQNSAAQLEEALQSILNQTRLPDEILVVTDGPVSKELEETIFTITSLRSVISVTTRQSSSKLDSALAAPEIHNSKLVRSSEDSTKDNTVKIKYLPLEKNRGLGETLRIAVEHTECEYVARMDADDICLPDRFEKQMKCFEEDPELSLVGGMITEFVDTPDNIVDERILPLEDAEIKKFMGSRCGVNHVTVIFKKEDLIKAGNYRSDYRQEDYYLWVRMMKVGCKFKNIPDVVVNVRSGKDQYARRSGWRYYMGHCAIFRLMYHEGMISFPRLVFNYVVRGVVQFLMPNWLRTWTYQHMLRK